MRFRTAFVALATLAASAVLPAAVPGAASAHPSQHRHTTHHRHVLRVPDCEDTDGPVTPCVTVDDGRWRLVTSYAPYRYRTLHVCVTKDEIGSRIVGPVPCVWDTWRKGDGVPSGAVSHRYLVFYRHGR